MDTNLQQYVKAAINRFDSPAAIKALSIIKRDPSLQMDPQLPLQLKYIRMNSLTEDQFIELMKNSVMAAYSIPDFDLFEKVKDYVELLDRVDLEVKVAQAIVKILAGSEELLGSQDITVKEVLVKPTLANWIKDFMSYPSHDQTKDALAEFEYMNSSPNVKSLTPAQQEILKNILKLYDRSQGTVMTWENTPTPDPASQPFKDFDLYNFIPGLEDDSSGEAGKEAVPDVEPEPAPNPEQTVPDNAPQSSSRGEGDMVTPYQTPPSTAPAPRSSQPVTPTLEPRAQKRSIDEIVPQQRVPQMPELRPQQPNERVKAQPLPENIYIDELAMSEESKRRQQAMPQQPPQPPQPARQPASPRPIPRPPAPKPVSPKQQNPFATEHTGGAKIHDLINHIPQKKGIVKDPTNIKISEEQKRLEQERAKQASQIQDKLADLRKRNSDK